MTTEVTAAERHERSPSATNPVEGTHWHILWLIKEGQTPGEVASLLGSRARWMRTVLGRWESAGEPAMREHRRTLPGAAPLLSLEHPPSCRWRPVQRPQSRCLDARASGAASRASRRLGLLAVVGGQHPRAASAACEG